MSIFSFLDLRSPGKICYNYIKKGERKKTFAGFAQRFSSNLSMRLSGENEGRGESALFCQQTFATKKTGGKNPPQELGKYPPKAGPGPAPGATNIRLPHCQKYSISLMKVYHISVSNY